MGTARGHSRDWMAVALGLLSAACLIIGILDRFRGLGRWPLTIDEYYLAQSVQNIMREGLPRYACGGLYVRGLALQYLSVLLQYAGLSAELAPRLIAALSSLIALPAAYLLGRRLGGRDVGLMTVALLSISVWETEVARFGRMYAPFQALFLWYLVCFLAYTLDRRTRALLPMLVLSAVGVLVWEGGVFLALANLLPPFIRNPSGRLQRGDWKYLAGVALLCVPSYWLATADLRTRGSEPALPANYQPPPLIHLSRLDLAHMPWTTLHLHPGWALLALVPAALALWAFIRLARDRIPPLALLGAGTALGCALLQQFELLGALVLVMGLLSILEWRVLWRRQMWPFHATVLVCLVYWSLFGLLTSDWHAPGLSARHTDFLLAYQLIRFPDVVRNVAAPWLHAVPVLSLVLVVLIGAACIHAAAYATTPAAERVALALIVIFLLAAGASHPPRQETRYVFFLYPLAILLAIGTVARLMRAMVGTTAASAALTLLVVFGGFALTEDFRPRHLWNIDTEAVTFRRGMSPREAAHYQARSDIRGAAQWLGAHVDRARDVVINSFPGVDFYYPYGDFYFMEETDPRFESWSCREGRFERWSNLPLLHSVGALEQQMASGRTVWLVMEASRLEALEARFPAGSWRIEWRSPERDIVILSSHETPTAS